MQDILVVEKDNVVSLTYELRVENHNGKLIESLRDFEKSTQLAVDNFDAFCGLCLIYHGAGKIEVLDTTIMSCYITYYQNICAVNHSS